MLMILGQCYNLSWCIADVAIYNRQDASVVSNPLNRYALSDRSNITYADGSFVYGGEGYANDSFELPVQPADLEPPKNWTSKYVVLITLLSLCDAFPIRDVVSSVADCIVGGFRLLREAESSP
jgi:hypothetical protein